MNVMKENEIEISYLDGHTVDAHVSLVSLLTTDP